VLPAILPGGQYQHRQMERDLPGNGEHQYHMMEAASWLFSLDTPCYLINFTTYLGVRG
jgi:hypothetical protein